MSEAAGPLPRGLAPRLTLDSRRPASGASAGGRFMPQRGAGRVITTACSYPPVRAAMWRFAALTSWALSQPRLALDTVSAARTAWGPMTATDGTAWRRVAPRRALPSA